MRQLSILVFIFFTACNDNNQASQQISVDTSHVTFKTILTDTTNQPGNTWIDLLNNKKYSLPDSIEGKPVSFYINNSKVYGVLSVLIQAFYQVEYLFDVNPQCFNPPPKVQSGVIRLRRKKRNPAGKK